MTRLRSALWLPLFDELADPRTVAILAAEAEEAGWDGCFVWDHLAWRAPVQRVADPWITLAAIATATERIRLGPMVTALARRRPVKVARETATLDVLSDGRFTLGVGLGSDRFAAEFSKTGEQVDDRVRAEQLDESLEILAAAWSGDPVHHRGTHYTVDDIAFLPRPVQRPGVPVWAAAMPGSAKPLRRAARLDGFFPVNPRASRPARRSGGCHRPAPRRRPNVVRHRDRRADRRRPETLRGSGCHLVAAGTRAGHTPRHRAGRSPRRPRADHGREVKP
jgi:alkanesulfonate monooxygenase SsuD/methylene tetrahydromethanopterin reductase-like flavin-dependent oxidoreductase (luciferase family)